MTAACESDRWWPDGLHEWIGMMADSGDPLYVALNDGLRSFGWPDYNVPQPLPRENSWPGLALALAQRHREASR